MCNCDWVGRTCTHVQESPIRDEDIPEGKVDRYTTEVSSNGGRERYVIGRDKNGNTVRESLATFDRSKLESYYGGF